MIDTDDTLSSFVHLLSQAPRVALDTEADSLHWYFEKLCLIQVSIPGSDVLIDPLAGFSLQPFLDTISARELILHGADFDLRLLRKAGLASVGRIFDTMIAARLTGRLSFSLAALISEFFGLALVKSSQKANWAIRPLPQKMIDYALNDTRYLFSLAEHLEAELRQLGRWTWFEQSCEKAVSQSAINRERDLENAWRISGCSELAGQSSAVLRSLWQWREDEARRIDRPPFHILRNEDMVDSAHRFARGEAIRLPHLEGGRRRRFYLAAEAALQLPETEWPQPPRRIRFRPAPGEEERFRDLKKRRDHLAGELKLDPALIASKAVLENLAGGRDEGRLLPWQRELLGLNREQTAAG